MTDPITRLWLDNPAPAEDEYWRAVRIIARSLDSDGCTFVSDIFIDACYEHDIHWRTGKTIFDAPITTAEANRRFRRVIQSRSRFGRYSPVSWVRWLGVTLGGHVLKHTST